MRLKIFKGEKVAYVRFVLFVLLLGCVFVLFVLFVLFVRVKYSRKKKRFEIALMTSTTLLLNSSYY